MRVTAPTYTQTPNDLFDHWLPLLGEAELKVLLVIMRKTFGWHKKRDSISISQLAKATGMLEETVVKAAKSLHTKGVITRQVVGSNGTQHTYYELVISEDSNNSYPSDEPRGPLGLNPPVKTEAQKKHSSLKEKQQTNKEENPPQTSKDDCLFAFLDGLDLTNASIKSLSKEFEDYPESLKWAIEKAKKAKINTSLGGYIRKMAREWVFRFKNHKYAGEVYHILKDKYRKSFFHVHIKNDRVQFLDDKTEIRFDLNENGFKQTLDNELRKRDLFPLGGAI